MTTKQNTTQQAQPAFRLIVRGTNEKGKRIRRCKYVHAAGWQQADEAFAKYGPELVKGLRDVYTNVFVPLS